MDDFLDMGFFDLVGWLALFVGALVVVFVIAMIWIAISDRRQMKKKHRHSASNRPAPQAKGRQSGEAPSANLSKDPRASYGYSAPSAAYKILDILKGLFRTRERPSSAGEEEEVDNGENASQWNPSAFTDAPIDRRAKEWDAQEQDAIDVPGDILRELRKIRGLLVEGVTQNERHQNAILDALKRTRNPVEEQPRRSVSQQVNYQKPQYEENRKEPWLDTLSRLYNSSVENPDRQSQFKQHYQTIRIGVVNAGQRIRDPNIDPQFKEMSAGDYWAVRMDDGQYAVVLRFNLSIETANYGPGAIEWAFNCLGYIPGKSYYRVRVNRPAIFCKEGENWVGITPGELDFSLG